MVRRGENMPPSQPPSPLVKSLALRVAQPALLILGVLCGSRIINLVQIVGGQRSAMRSCGRHRGDPLAQLPPTARRVIDGGPRSARKEIARDMNISQATVKFHVSHIFQKLDVGSRTEAVASALQLGIVSQT